MTLLCQNTTPAERFRGCQFAEKFFSENDLIKNGGQAINNPDFCGDGVLLDGVNQYIQYNETGTYFQPNTDLSFVLEFIPNFEADDGEFHALLDIDSAGNRALILKRDANSITLLYGGASVGVPQQDYENYWLTGQRNVMTWLINSSGSSLWLNGIKVYETTVLKTGASVPDGILSLGAYNAGAFPSPMRILSFWIFNKNLEQQEILDYYNNETYTYESGSVLALPMRMCQHDPDNTRTLDVSGNDNHAAFGDGATSSTYPTKLAKRGYDFDSSDYLTVPRSVSIEPTKITVCVLYKEELLSDFGNIVRKTTGNLGYLLMSRGNSDTYIFACGTGASIPIASSTTNPKYKIGQYVTLVGVNDGTNSYIYVDGKLEGSVASTLVHATSEDLFVLPTAAGVYQSEGAMQKMDIYDKALTPTQVADWTIKAKAGLNIV